MTAIPFPTSSRPGGSPALGQGRLVNVYASKDGPLVEDDPVDHEDKEGSDGECESHGLDLTKG